MENSTNVYSAITTKSKCHTIQVYNTSYKSKHIFVIVGYRKKKDVKYDLYTTFLSVTRSVSIEQQMLASSRSASMLKNQYIEYIS